MLLSTQWQHPCFRRSAVLLTRPRDLPDVPSDSVASLFPDRDTDVFGKSKLTLNHGRRSTQLFKTEWRAPDVQYARYSTFTMTLLSLTCGNMDTKTSSLECLLARLEESDSPLTALPRVDGLIDDLISIFSFYERSKEVNIRGESNISQIGGHSDYRCNKHRLLFDFCYHRGL